MLNKYKETLTLKYRDFDTQRTNCGYQGEEGKREGVWEGHAIFKMNNQQ